jgi:lipopolysaccharide export system protein LptC
MPQNEDYKDVLKAKEGLLDFIRPRETARVVKARSSAYTRLVARLRFILPAVAVLALAAVIVWPMVSPNKIAKIVMKNIPDLVIDNLHFTGMDSKNQPYSLTAVKATRPSGHPSLYDLDQPQAEMTLDNGTWVAGKAKYGRYDETTRQLWLGGNVHVFQDKGYEFTTDEAQVDTENRNAWGEKPVMIQGQFGEIWGQGFRLLDSGQVMVVKGPAKAVLNLHPAEGSDKPSQTK